MHLTEVLKKVWYFLWEEESIWSWLANLAIAFVVIKYLLYPGLGLLLGTPAPIVAVVSGSMEHEGNFDQFWTGGMCCNSLCTDRFVQGNYYENMNISREMFMDFDFVNGFNKGDIMILYSPKKSQSGDVVVYVVPNRPDPIIHRVLKISEENGKKYYWTKGDHNCDMGAFEKQIPEERVIGKAVWRVPFLGYVKIAAVWLWQLVF